MPLINKAQAAAGQLTKRGREELPRVRGQGQWPGGANLRLRTVKAGRRHPASEIRGGQEKPPHARGQGWWPEGATRGAVAEQAQEGLEELSHVEGQEWWW